MQKSKKEVIKDLKINSKDVGSSEVQIAQLTDKIENLSAHIKKFKKDKHSSVGLLKAVNRRKKLLEYLKRKKSDAYKNILTDEQVKILKDGLIMFTKERFLFQIF